MYIAREDNKFILIENDGNEFVWPALPGMEMVLNEKYKTIDIALHDAEYSETFCDFYSLDKSVGPKINNLYRMLLNDYCAVTHQCEKEVLSPWMDDDREKFIPGIGFFQIPSYITLSLTRGYYMIRFRRSLAERYEDKVVTRHTRHTDEVAFQLESFYNQKEDYIQEENWDSYKFVTRNSKSREFEHRGAVVELPKGVYVSELDNNYRVAARNVDGRSEFVGTFNYYSDLNYVEQLIDRGHAVYLNGLHERQKRQRVECYIRRI